MKVLFCGEATYLKSGYAIYGKNLISRIHATSGFEVAEFANYGSSKDKRSTTVPWKMYCNLPENPEEEQIYNSNKMNHFGAYKFEKVCLDFKPDVVISYLDSWMMRHQLTSPFRPFYKIVWMPAVDASPQNISWLNMYSEVDAVFGYTDWASDILKEQSGNKINPIGSAHYCAEESYKPIPNKKQHKENLGLGGLDVIGFVSRNQKRKLFPDLFTAFRKYLDKYNHTNAALYCHTTYPDGGWDIPSLLKEHRITNKVFFTYVCRGCGRISPSLFHDAGKVCPECGGVSVIANLDISIPPEALCSIMNTFDLYVHYANSEAWGMAQIEAAACGIPVMGINYAGMSDILEKLDAIKLTPIGFSKELETGCLRAIPDNDNLVENIHRFMSMPESVKISIGHEIRDNFLKNYNWDIVAQKWIEYLKSISNSENRWKSKPRIYQVPQDFPKDGTESEFVRWLITDVLVDESKIGSLLEAKILRNLTFGSDMENYPVKHYSREDAFNLMKRIAENRNFWETARMQLMEQK